MTTEQQNEKIIAKNILKEDFLRRGDVALKTSFSKEKREKGADVDEPLWWNWQTRVAANSALSTFRKRKVQLCSVAAPFPKKSCYAIFFGNPVILSPLLCFFKGTGHQTSSYLCRCGGIGRRKGLKIPR